jgi:hypothetical protein
VAHDAGTGRAHRARSPHVVRACNDAGVLTDGSVVPGRWQGATGELMGATERVSGKAVRGGAHPNDGATWRRWRSLGTSAFIGGERAPVADGDRGVALQCWCGRGKVRAASIGDNGGGWEGLIVKRRRRWLSDGNRRGGGVSGGGSW